MNLDEALAPLDPRHRRALEWFRANTGRIVAWPGPLDGEVLLATKAKGIYKPEWSDYALSVRQTRNTDYPDRDPIALPDNSWVYEYHQEGHDPAARDEHFTNVALLKCAIDSVPVGVLRQDPRRAAVGYVVLGLAIVIRWEAGFFLLGGCSTEGIFPSTGRRGELAAIEALATAAVASVGAFDPLGVFDAREKTFASIVRRRGQTAFRDSLLGAYGGRCAVTAYDEPSVLEAAHIVPYMGAETNHPANGLLLRADIHTLFDLGLIAIDTDPMVVLLAPEVGSGSYAPLASARLNLPTIPHLRPSKQALDLHREWTGL